MNVLRSPLFILIASLVLALLVIVFVSDRNGWDLFGARESGSEVAGEEKFVQATITASRPGFQRVSHERYGFSFEIPDRFSMGNFKEGEEGEMVLVQDGSATGEGFQIYITPFLEGESLFTLDRVKTDIPDLIIEEPQSVRVGGAPGFFFGSRGGSFGESAELWFVHGGYLYQASTYRTFQTPFIDIMKTLQFVSE